jgi:tRNA C32,U32 (ribose-2'-O)-methylase TrmJ
VQRAEENGNENFTKELRIMSIQDNNEFIIMNLSHVVALSL